MIQFLRSLFKSRFGAAIAIAFLVLIALAFAAGDVANVQGGGGSTAGDRVATAGKERITAAQVSQAASAAVEDLKRRDPRMNIAGFAASGGLEKIVDQLLDRVSLGVFGRSNKIVASERLIDSEIAKVPAFRGPDGKFSDSAFRQMLQQQGLTEQLLRDDLAQSLIARQLMVPAEAGAVMPVELTLRYATLLRDSRSGAIALIPSAAFAPKTPPTDAELQAFYAKNRDKFIRPERRVLRYATFGEAALKTVPAPTEAEVAARYNANKAQYAAQETRRITQLIVPTEAAAKAILAEVSGGKRLEQVASAKGLSAASLGALSKEALAKQSSAAVADASFATASGSIVTPARSALGWHIMRIDGIDKRAERSLDSVRGELTSQLAVEKRRTALNDFSAALEEQFDEGGNLADAAKELGLTLQQTAEITADGQVYGKPGAAVPPALTKLVQTAFAMEKENQPQLAEVEAGKTFVIFDVSAITASAPAPLAEIKNDVLLLHSLEKGSVAAKAAADKVLAATKNGTALSAAMTTLGTPLPPVQNVDMPRTQLQQFGNQIPPPLQLLFSMAKGTTKLLAAPDNRGWYVLSLKNIVPGSIDPKDPQFAAAQREFGQLAGSEYAEQLTRAIRSEVGVTRNEPALKALRTQLTGGN